MMASRLTLLVLIGLAIAAYAGVFTALADFRKIPWRIFWGGSAAIMAPWLIATLVVNVASTFVPAHMQSGAGMLPMFPGLVFMLTVPLAPVISLFASGNVDLVTRIKWFGGLSAVPAALVAGVLIYVMISEGIDTGRGGG